MNDALKTCPFCGNAPYTDEETAVIMGNRTGHRFAIACQNCEVSALGASDMPAAITEWNTRADLHDAQIAALVGLVERAQQNTSELYARWHGDARAALSAIRSTNTGESR